ncbi:LysE family translocator [Arthrobacter flavus]
MALWIPEADVFPSAPPGFLTPKDSPVTTSNYLALLGVAIVLALTPGPDTLLTLKYALRRRRAGFFSALGSAVGVFGWAALVAAGVATFFQDSPMAFNALRVVGGLYLFYLGYRSLTAHPRTAVKETVKETIKETVSAAVPLGAGTGPDPVDFSAGDSGPGNPSPHGHTAGWSAFSAGVLCCLTNPKTGLFFLALIPQFTPTDAGALYVIAVVGGTVSAVIGGYLMVVALGAHTAGVWLNRPTTTLWIERISGLVFVGLGLLTILPALSALV